MAANNNITIIGRLGADPELVSRGDKSFAKLRVAVSRIGKDSPTDWFEVNIWGVPAERAMQYLKKGTLLSVSGSCNIDEWVGKDGSKRLSVKIRADHFQMLGSKQESQSEPPKLKAKPWKDEDDEDIPSF